MKIVLENIIFLLIVDVSKKRMAECMLATLVFYVTGAEPVLYRIYPSIIHDVQNRVRDNFTFKFRPVGSSGRNMITYNKKSNIGLDFDFDLEINDDEENYEPGGIRRIIKMQ